MYSEGYMYLGLRASTTDMIVGNIFINRGEDIYIFHVSAALGTAIYKKGEDSWQRSQDFVWRCRRTDDSEAAQAERDAFLEEEGWASVNSRMGTPNELEYKIAVTDGTLRLALNYIKASNTSVKIPWPDDLDDDCIKPTPGGLPEQLDFSPDRWATLVISSPER
jgi:hypothetical protein